MKPQYQTYHEVLANFPIPGEGNKSHSYIMTAANKAKQKGRSPEEAVREIFEAIPIDGEWQIDISEVEEAVEKAYSTKIPKSYRTQTARPKQHPTQKPDFDAFIEGYYATEDDVIASSPIAINAGVLESSIQLLSLYNPDEYIFIGPRYGSHEYVMTCAEWIERLQEIVLNDEIIYLPHIIPNPLSGKVGKTGTGKDSYRCDNCVQDYRFALAEFDNICKQDQFAFWAAAISKGFPVAALIDSGGKSIHGWLAVRCQNREEWELQVEQRLFPELLIPLGCDLEAK